MRYQDFQQQDLVQQYNTAQKDEERNTKIERQKYQYLVKQRESKERKKCKIESLEGHTKIFSTKKKERKKE